MLDRLIPNASSYAGSVDQLVLIITLLVGFWFFAAEGMLFWLIWRFRERKGVPGQYVTGKEKHLKQWINIPHGIVLVFDVVIVIFAVKVWVNVKQTLPPADRTIRVMSQQWAWTFTDPGPDGVLDTADDIRTTDELHLESDKTYHFELQSKDVVHSFFIPAFRLKQDAVPGRVYTGWFRPTKPGDYDISCAQICGIGHGVMGARLVVENAADHAAWMQAHPATADGAAAPADTATTGTAEPAAATH